MNIYISNKYRVASNHIWRLSLAESTFQTTDSRIVPSGKRRNSHRSVHSFRNDSA
jgi:hypothetical protein